MRSEYNLNEHLSIFHNLKTDTLPMVLHANGPWYVKAELNFMANWLAFWPSMKIPFRSRIHRSLDASDDVSIFINSFALQAAIPAEPFHGLRVLISIYIDLTIHARLSEEWAVHVVAFVNGLLRQDYPRHGVLFRIQSANNDVSRSAVVDLIIPRLLSQTRKFAGVQHISDERCTTLDHHRRDFRAAMMADVDMLITIDQRVVLTNPEALRTMVLHNVPGVLTLSLYGGKCKLDASDCREDTDALRSFIVG